MNAKFLRTILTAAHCICFTREELSYNKDNGNSLMLFTSCRLPLRDKSNPTHRLNQHIYLKDHKGSPLKSKDIEMMSDKKMKTRMNSFNHFNHMDVKIGSRDHTTGVFQGAKYAYVMYVKAKDSSAKPDIGLIVVERDILRKSEDYPEGHVAPLCLPSR